MMGYVVFGLACCVLLHSPVLCDRPLDVQAVDAGDACKHGLATYNDVKQGFANTTGFDNGHSGWISGYADLSRVLSFEGCFDSTQTLIQTKHVGVSYAYNLHYCSKLCNDDTFSYMGLKGDTCYCLKSTERNSMLSVDCDTDCNTTTLSVTCTAYVGVYRFAGNIQPQGQEQCIYISRPDQDTSIVHYGTASCHTVSGISIHGFICEYAKFKCNETSNYKHKCLEDKFNHSWMQAYAYCKDKGGSLISTAHSNIFVHLIPSRNKYYWIGGFRAIAPTEKQTKSCLAVTKVGDQYLLDSDDCKTSKRPVCSTRDLNSNANTESAPTVNPSKTPGAKQRKSNQLPIIIGVTLAVMAVIVGIVCVVFAWRRKRNYTNINDNTLLKRENDFTNTGSDNNAIIEGGDDLEQAGTRQNEAPGGEMKSAPIKPERHTLRRQKQSIQSYENFQLIPSKDTQTVTVQLSEPNLTNDEYDRVDLKQTQQRWRGNASRSENDTHIYNHTVNAHNDENYDTTSSRPSANGFIGDYSVTGISKSGNAEYNTVGNVHANAKTNHCGTSVSKWENDDYRETDVSNNASVVYSVVNKNSIPLKGNKTEQTIQNNSTSDISTRTKSHQLQTLKCGLDDAIPREPESEYVYIDDDRLILDTMDSTTTRHGHSDENYDAIGPETQILGHHTDKDQSKALSESVYEDIINLD